MEPNSTYDQEIDLKDLMFAVLYKWLPGSDRCSCDRSFIRRLQGIFYV